MNKKGISAVVATILIVLLSVVAVTIVWAVLKPAITKTASRVSTSCIEVDLSIDEADCSAGTVKVTLNAGEINNLKFIFINDTDSNVITKEPLGELETKTYKFTAKEVGSAAFVNVAAVILSEAKEEITCSPVLSDPLPC